MESIRSYTLSLVKRDYFKIILLLICSRFILLFIGVTSRHFLITDSEFLKNFVNVWAQWDAGWYSFIAAEGYATDHFYNPFFGGQANYAFFPLYPFLIKMINYIFHDYALSGIIISNFCLVVASVYLYKLALLYFDRNKSFNIVVGFIFFPASFLFSCVLTESLYLCLVLICFYYAKKDKWLLVGTIGFALAFTRNIGVFLIIPLIFQYIINVKYKLYEIKYNALFLLLIPAGFTLWGMYLYKITGDFLMFKQVQITWGRISSNPVSVLYSAFSGNDFNSLFLACYTVIITVIIIYNLKRIPLPYLIFSLYSVIIPLSTSVDSMVRYSIVIFPLYFLIGYLEKQLYKLIFLNICLTLQGLFFTLWSSGYPFIF